MGEQFRNERDADACNGGPDHSGWLTDSEGYDKAIGIVASLTHGRYIAGYRWTLNDERVYFDGVFTAESEAARMADEHARVFADSVREDNARYETMRDALDLFTAALQRREMARGAIEELRTTLEVLSEVVAAYENV